MNEQVKRSRVGNSAVGLMLKIGGIFAVSFVLFFMSFLAYDLLSGFTRTDAPAAQPADETKLDVDIPKIADELAKVLASNTEPYSQEVKDPFSDRGGLSSGPGGSSSSNSTSAAVSKGGTSPAANTAPVTPVKPEKGSSANSAPPETVAVEGTRERYVAWLSRASISGDATLDARVFAIEDLTPVGIVDGGNGQQEVMFYSQAAEKTVSFPVGTMFFDGWLTELRPEGVVFSSNDERRIVRMRSWARSIKNLG